MPYSRSSGSTVSWLSRKPSSKVRKTVGADPDAGRRLGQLRQPAAAQPEPPQLRQLALEQLGRRPSGSADPRRRPSGNRGRCPARPVAQEWDAHSRQSRRRPEYGGRPMRVLLVCSPGGHLQQMLALEPAWRGSERSWVTLPGADVELPAGRGGGDPRPQPDQPQPQEPAPQHGHGLAAAAPPAPGRDPLHRRRPGGARSSSSAGCCGIRLVYVESVTRTESLSLSGRLVYPLASRFFVQWPAVAERHRRAEYAGGIL